MPDDTNQSNNQSGDQTGDQANQQDGNTGGSKEVVLACDTNNENDQTCQDTVEKILKDGGYTVIKLPIGPNEYATYSYSGDAKGKQGAYMMAASLLSFLDAAQAGFDYNVLGIRGDVTGWTDEEWKGKRIPKDWHGDCTMPECDTYQGKTYPELNEVFKGKCVAVPGETCEKLGQNILAALGGGGVGGASTGSGGGAQIKDKTFEKCIRRICAATDSIFLVENNAAILFPYTDWMAFTLRQKINVIKSDEIDPNVFGIEYGNEGFYNKVSIAWGGGTLPERFPSEKDGKKQVQKDKITNYTAEDILKNMQLTHFIYDPNKVVEVSDKKTENKNKNTNQSTDVTTTKKGETTQKVSIDPDGTTMLSEQYDKLVEIYGEMEKRVESAAPDLETAQYIVNALLIQYIRDFNNSCKVRALNVRKYIGGTFYAVENPFDKTSELYYLNSYTIRTQKDAPLYHDLDFRYGPEGAEEILDYQTLSGGAANGGASSIGGGSATEEAIWQDAAKCKWAQDQPDCSTQDPATAKKHYDDYAAKGEEVHFDCYGMSAYLYYRFNNEAKIPCQVVGNSAHHVVMLDRGNGFESTQDDYRNYNLDYLFKWRSDQDTTVLLPAPNSNSSTSGGNTNSSNTNGGNSGGSS